MSHPFRAATLAASLLLAAACSDTTRPVAPDRPDLARGSDWQEPPDADRARDQRLARRFALALADDDFRAAVHAQVAASTAREGRIQLQRFLYGNSHRELTRLGRVTGDDAGPDLRSAPSMEVYLPVPEHRARWRGGRDVLVATTRADGEIPVAFDLRGRKVLLDPARPPATPVLAVQQWEGGDDLPCEAACVSGLGFDDGGSPPPPTYPPSPATGGGLFLTGTRFSDKFEGWLKGAPEFEVHVLGQKTGTAELVSYQCIGEQAGAPYAFNQDDLTWSGSVLMFSTNQLAEFRANHPGQGLRLLVLEDDDGPCQIKVDKDRVTSLFKVVDAAWSAWTSGQEVKITSLQSKFQKAKSLFQVVSELASFFKTNDDLVGTAVEDASAGYILSGATWTVRGTNNTVTGALRLEMR